MIKTRSSSRGLWSGVTGRLTLAVAGPTRAYRNSIDALACWLTPARVHAYPMALGLGPILFFALMLLAGNRAGIAVHNLAGRDFAAFYTGGRLFLEGRTAELYDFRAQAAIQDRLFPQDAGRLAPFLYPPFTAILYSLFSAGDYTTGLLGWWAAGLVALLASAALIRREMFAGSIGAGRLFLASFLFYPTFNWLLFGQNTAFSLLLYVLAFVLLRREKDFWAGLAAGMLIYKPQLAVALGVALVVKRRWRALLGAMAGAGLWISAGVILAPSAMLDYLRFYPSLLGVIGHEGSKMWGVQTLYGFSVLLLGDVWPAGADLLGKGVSIGALLVLGWWWTRIEWRPKDLGWDMAMAAPFAGGLLIVPYLFHYDLMLLLLPLAIVFSRLAPIAGRPLDGGPVLAWTAAVYVAVLAGSYFTLAQLALAATLSLPAIALQIGVPVIGIWAWEVARLDPKSRADGFSESV